MIRSAKKEDLAELVKIENSAFSVEPWTRGMFFDALTQEHITVYVYDVCGIIAGFCVLSAPKFCDAEIQNLAVRSGYRKLGIGKTLLEHAICEARKKYCFTMFLDVGVENLAAQKLYNKCGFEIISTRENYYGSAVKGKNAFVMRRKERREGLQQLAESKKLFDKN